MGDHNLDTHGLACNTANSKFASSRVRKMVVSGVPFIVVWY